MRPISLYWRDILLQASGNGIAQIVGVIGMPVLSRLYSPVDFGIQNLFLQVAILVAGLMTLRYEQFVQLPKDEADADAVCHLALSLGTTVVLDTVPFDAALWRHDPFRLTNADGRLYGLGTSDMKGFFPLVMEAARRFRADSLAEPLIVLATADEESSMDGAKMLVEVGRPRARYAVIGEPTGLVPVRMHKGILMEGVRVVGRSGHSSDPTLGANALEGMTRVLRELLTWRGELQARYRNAQFHVPVPTLNLGHIHGGDNPNRICGMCELHIDLRPLPGMDLEELRAEMRTRLTALLAGSELGLEVFPLFSGTPALETPANSFLVQAAEAFTGAAAEAVAFGTEGPYLQQLGAETIILGPGNIAEAHQPNEYLALDRLQPTVELLTSLIKRFCVDAVGQSG